MKPISRILHLTDLHLFDNNQTEMFGINPFHTLKQILVKITNDITSYPPDLIVLTGDLSQDNSLDSYKTAAQILKNFPSPLATTMGNHDHYLHFIKIFGKPTPAIANISMSSNWQILLVNSRCPKQVAGKVTKTKLELLEKNLAKNSTKPAIIFLHHHVLPVGSNWLDKIKLQNSEQFLEIIDRHKNVKAIVCGHVHQATTILRNHVMFLSTPATSWQFMPNSNEFKLDALIPGYRWINLYSDGTIQTEVARIKSHAEFTPNVNSAGY